MPKVLSLGSFLKENYNLDGDIILYRDDYHKKKGLCEYLKEKLGEEIGDREIYISSDGAFSLYNARIFKDNKIKAYCKVISPDYGELMLATPNLEVIEGKIHSFLKMKELAYNNNAYFLNQYREPLCKEYYKNYFPKVLENVRDYKINAFCDCGHSCGTIAGFYEKKMEIDLDIEFILGVNSIKRGAALHQAVDYEKKFRQMPINEFDSYEVGKKIEKEFPNFGNVYEATWSICAAMSYIKRFPQKNVLVFVGDSFEKEGTKFR